MAELNQPQFTSAPVSAQAEQYSPQNVFIPGATFDHVSEVYPLAAEPRDFALGDLNDDGFSDIAVVFNGSSIYIFNGTMSGILDARPWIISLASKGISDIRSIAIGDLDRDNLNDIAISYALPVPRISIFFQINNYNPASCKDLPSLLANSDPYQIAIGNFSDDTYNDLVLTVKRIPNNLLYIFKSPFADTDLRYIPFNGITNPQLLSVGAINNDDKPDIFIGNLSGRDGKIFEQPLTFTDWFFDTWPSSTLLIPGQISDAKLANMGGAGTKDLVLINSQNNRVEVWFNTGSGLSGGTVQVIGIPSGTQSVSVGNLSGSNAPDISVTNVASSNCSIYFPTTMASWSNTPNLTAPSDKTPLKTIVRDTDLPLPGIYVLNRGRSGLNGSLEFFHYVDGNLTSAQRDVVLSGSSPGDVAAGSLNGHNITIATVLPSSNQLCLYDINASRKWILSTGSSPNKVIFGDFNEDGFNDIAVLNSGSATISIYDGSTDLFTSLSPNVTLDLGIALPSSIGIVRPNGGTMMTNLVVGYNGGVAIVYDPLGLFTVEKVTLGGGGNRSEVISGKFFSTGNGGDIAALNKEGGFLEIYRRSLTGSPGSYFTQIITLDKATYLGNSLTSGDYNGDGLTDLAMGTTSSSILLYNQSLTNGFLDNQVRSWTFSLPSSTAIVSSGDLNDDGRCDLLVTHSDGPFINAYLSKQGSGFVRTIEFTSGGVAASATIVDLNGDKRSDVVSTAIDSSSLGIWFQNNLEPKASATLNGTATDVITITEGNSIAFDGASSTDSFSDQNNLQFLWTFGDGATSESKSCYHTYNESSVSTYDGQLMVTDRNGLSNTTNFKITVNDISPVASFLFEPDYEIENSTIWFNDTSSHYDTITTWTWGIGGDTFAYTQNATHRFTQDGTYPVWLNITEGDGDWSNTSRVVHVTDGVPVAGITPSNLIIDEGLTITFNDDSTSSQDAITNWTWNFDDGTDPIYTEDATHPFAVSGTYNVTLTIVDSDGSTSMANVIITVLDTAPVASFTVSKLEPLEGETLILTSTSYAYDGIASLKWELDGHNYTTPNINYIFWNPGDYLIALTVVDADGTTTRSERTITVQSTSPTIGPITTSGGQITFTMDEQIDFQVSAQPALVPIHGYAWDFDYNEADGFVETPGISINQTSWSYHTPGEYVVCVQVWDSNSCNQTTLTVVIQNMRPVASFTVQATGSSNYSFDASMSWDTASDNSSLQFRWNFADGTGWTAWSSFKNAWVIYTAQGNYDVILEVRDQWDKRGTISILVDNGPPTLDLDMSTVLTKAYRGDRLVVRVNVTDVSTIEQVVLFYDVDNATYSITMSRLAGTDTYVATIPSLNFTGPLTYHVEAEDVGGHRSVSTPMSVSVLERPSDDWIYVLAVALATILAILFFYFRALKMVVDEVFFIYEDGNLIAHQTRRLKPGMDDQILGGMLVAIQNFVRDSFKDEASTGLNRMDFGEKKVLVEKGDHIYLAVVLHGTREGKVPQRMKDTIFQAEADFRDVLNDWDGDLDKFRGIKDRAGPLLKGSVMDVLPAHGQDTEGSAEEKALDAETIDCPVCGVHVGLASTKCPNCGATMALGELVDMTNENQEDGGPGRA